MASGVRETKWVVTIDGNVQEASSETVDALKAMASEYERNKKALDQLNSALKSTGKGNAEVTKSLKKQIEQLKARQSVLTQSAAKYGHSITSIIKQAKKEAAEREKFAKKIAAVEAKAYGMLGGKLGALRGRFREYRELVSQEGGRAALLKASLTGAASAAVSLSTAATMASVALGIGFAGAAAAATASLTKWIVLTASSRQQTMLQMQAWVRTSENARNLADQVDALAMKVPTATRELEKLAIELRQSGLRGGTLVDSLNAVGQASAALGDQAGAKIQEFLTRYQRLGVLQINPVEMYGTGLDFDDVAGALAKQMGVSIEKARIALATGRVKLADGAKAMRKAVEDRFGELNLRKLSDLSRVSEQFSKRLAALTKDVNLEPISRFLDRIYRTLDESSVSGQALKTLFESIAKAFGDSLDKNGDWIEYGLKEAIIISLKLATEIIRVKNRIEAAFNDGRTAAEKFNSILETVKSGLKIIFGLPTLAINPVQGAKWVGEGYVGVVGAIAGAIKRLSATSSAPATAQLPAHADGGVVTGIRRDGIAETKPLPAAGEGLASVGIGEVIIPRSQVRDVSSSRSVQIGEINVYSNASDPKEVAREVADDVVEKILHALEITGAQLGVT